MANQYLGPNLLAPLQLIAIDAYWNLITLKEASVDEGN